MRPLFVNRAAIAAITLLAICGISSVEGKPNGAQKIFQKLLDDRIGALWYASLQQCADQVSLGTVRLRLIISREGKILHLSVVSNTSNQLAADLAISAIKGAKMPPIPPDMLTHGRLEQEMTFTIYPN